MKKIISLGIIILNIFSCNQPAENKTERESIVESAKPNFDWLLGKWIRVNEKENKQTFEQWEKKTEDEYIGWGFTIQNKDTIWQENMKLINNTDSWSLDVIQRGEVQPTKFKLIEIEDDIFTCENQANEFPKIINYAKKADTLHAKISGGDMEVVFDFVKEK